MNPMGLFFIRALSRTLLFLCLGTILAPSCQRSSSPPPRLGPSWQCHSTPSAALQRSLWRSGPQTPLLHHQSQVLGRGHCCQPPQGLLSHAAAADCGVRTQAALPQPSGSHFQTRWFLHLPLRCSHETVPETFSYLGRRLLHAREGMTGGAIPGSTDTVPVPSTGTATEVGPLTSSPSSRGQSMGEALWRAGYTPADRPTSWGVLHHPCTVPVYKLLCNCQ
jgi:hypothetical protein